MDLRKLWEIDLRGWDLRDLCGVVGKELVWRVDRPLPEHDEIYSNNAGNLSK